MSEVQWVDFQKQRKGEKQKEEPHYLPDHLAKMLKRQQYALFGHSAVKTCHYTKKELTQGEGCYKNKFYGIESHRCLQMTPSVSYCEQKCTYCWRPLTEFNHFESERVDHAAHIAEKSIEMQRRQLSGFGSQMETIGKEKWEQSLAPKHVAISLAGEPTLYPYLSELVQEYKKRGMSVFLVTNGLHPEVLEKMELPTQLYVSVDAAEEETHRKLDRPQIRDAWARIMKTLSLLKNLECRTVIRLTCVKGMNMHNAEGFANLFRNAQPDFVELKGYSHVGYSRTRLSRDNAPSHEEVKSFAEDVNKGLGYRMESEHTPSRAVLLWNGTTPRFIDFDSIN